MWAAQIVGLGSAPETVENLRTLDRQRYYLKAVRKKRALNPPIIMRGKIELVSATLAMAISTSFLARI